MNEIRLVHFSEGIDFPSRRRCFSITLECDNALVTIPLSDAAKAALLGGFPFLVEGTVNMEAATSMSPRVTPARQAEVEPDDGTAELEAETAEAAAALRMLPSAPASPPRPAPIRLRPPPPPAAAEGGWEVVAEQSSGPPPAAERPRKQRKN